MVLVDEGISLFLSRDFLGPDGLYNLLSAIDISGSQAEGIIRLIVMDIELAEKYEPGETGQVFSVDSIGIPYRGIVVDPLAGDADDISMYNTKSPTSFHYTA